jgi:hypothetical protein
MFLSTFGDNQLPPIMEKVYRVDYESRNRNRILVLGVIFSIVTLILGLLPIESSTYQSNSLDGGIIKSSSVKTGSFGSNTGFGSIGCGIIAASCFITYALLKK